MSRPAHLMAVIGTHTEVGKTWVSAALLAQARSRGLRVGARKPVQSFDVDDGVTDAERLAAATGEQMHSICPAHRWYSLPMAPPMAANALGLPRILLDELAAEIAWQSGLNLGLVESVGGPRSPLAHDADSIDLVHRLQPDEVLLVAEAGLGAINAVRLAVQCVGALPTTIFLNRFNPRNELHRLNYQWLAEEDGFNVVSSIPVR